MRLIDADELLTAFPVDDEPKLTKSCVRMTIQHMATKESIIRCKDCKWKNKHNCTRAVEIFIDDDDFCSWAERREYEAD